MRWFGWFRKRPKAGTDMLEVLALQEGTPVALIGGRMRTVGLPYALPRDTEDLNRLDFQHFLLRYALKGLYAPPLHNPQSILDVGTGTGRWALDMAQVFPHAKVVGLDVNPPPMDENAGRGYDIRPPNYTFVPGNLLEGLPFADKSFDFVHMRLLFTAIPANRWVTVMREVARILKPGGWVESVETTGIHNGGPHTDLIMAWVTQLAAGRGVDRMNATHVNTFMQDAGLRNIGASVVNIPAGSWGGRIGEMGALDYLTACKGYGGVVVNAHLATQQQFDETLEGARVDLGSPHIHGYAPFYVVIGQK
jgi:ubiquinone/menaquinone biosynthesis C-methylase UbiE